MTKGAFATLFFGDYHVPTRRLRYVNCGHLPPLILNRDDSVKRLEATGTVLGVFEKWDCEVGESAVSAGDTHGSSEPPPGLARLLGRAARSYLAVGLFCPYLSIRSRRIFDSSV